MTFPTPFYGSVTWVKQNKNCRKIKSEEVKFLRTVKICIRVDKILLMNYRRDQSMYSINKKRPFRGME